MSIVDAARDAEKNLRQQVRNEAAAGVKPWVMLSLALSLYALWIAKGCRR